MFCTYMNDIITCGKDLDDQIHNLKLVFEKLREHKLLLQPDKCSFLKQSTTILGHVITNERVKPDENKIKAVRNFPTQTNKKKQKIKKLIRTYWVL